MTDKSDKPIHTVILDAGPIIKNEPSVSSLLAKSERLVTTPEVISEIKDIATRTRVESTLRPFLELRSPSTASVSFVQNFARRTGDIAVLSRTDINLIALAYEIECERNRGDWRLRKAPGQQRTNGPPPAPEVADKVSNDVAPDTDSSIGHGQPEMTDTSNGQPSDEASEVQEAIEQKPEDQSAQARSASLGDEQSVLSEVLAHTSISTEPDQTIPADEHASADETGSSSSDSEGWITPSNIKRQQTKDGPPSSARTREQSTMQVAIITTDYAMQNVILQINLNLLSPSLLRVQHLRNYVLRCHACFQISKDMSKQFCQRCGQPALTRVSCSTNASGEFKVHLKRNMQWNTRGDRYSIPKPTAGASNGRVKGGGKGGWGNDLILAEDQKEYVRAVAQDKRSKQRDLMDEDYLPSLLSNRRDERGGGRPKVGAGRNVNSKKR